MTVPRVLLIDDDENLAAMLSEYLGESGLDLAWVPDGEQGLRELARLRYDIVVLDVMLPKVNGFELLGKLRASNDVPVLMLTARGADTDRIVGLELGADDYLSKPFNPRELLARLRALLRRERLSGGRARPLLDFGRVAIDRDARMVYVEKQPRELTGHQFDLLVVLAENAGRVMTRDELLRRVRGAGLEPFDRSIDVHVSRIRAAIEEDPKKPKHLLTIRGTGYVFARRGAKPSG